MEFHDESETNSFISPSISQEDLYSEIFNDIFERYHVPFTQTSFSRMDSSIFTLKLQELQDTTVPLDHHQLLRKKWFFISKNFVLLNRLDTLFDYFLETNSNAKFLLQRNFFRKWSNKTINKSNREKWLRISSIIRTISWKKEAQDYSARLDARRIEIASNYLISQKEYKNPRYNFFILNAIPLQTKRKKELEELELEEDRLGIIGQYQENIDEAFEPNEEIINQDNSVSPKKKKKRKTSTTKEVKVSPVKREISPIKERQGEIHQVQNIQSPSIQKVHKNTSPSTQKVTQHQTSKLWIFALLILFAGTAFAAFAAFALGFGTPLAYLIHKGEYKNIDDFLESKKNLQANTNSVDNLDSSATKFPPMASPVEPVKNSTQDDQTESPISITNSQ